MAFSIGDDFYNRTHNTTDPLLYEIACVLEPERELALKPWQTTLIGLGVALVMIMLSLPITLYMAFDRDNSLKPAALGVFAMWVCLIVTGAVGGYLWPKILGSVERK
jgi:hypothetical protein